MKFLLLALVFVCVACKGQIENKVLEDSSSINDIKNNLMDDNQKNPQIVIRSLKQLTLKSDIGKSYHFIKKAVSDTKEKIVFNTKNADSVSRVFTNALLYRIIPFWEGTAWSFDGHTSKPKIGEIACGYFISTTLQDVGVSVNKYKLAQQSPINEAKSLAINSDVIEVSKGSVLENINEIKAKLSDGIHFIGFDQNHVGYILKEQNRLYLIHSNYIGAKGVEIEEIEKSDVFSSYDKFYLVPISSNPNFLKNWLENKPINVITE